MLRVNPETARRWLLDNFEVRLGQTEQTGEHVLRLRECPGCGHDKWAVRANVLTQRIVCFRHGCRYTLFDLVKLRTGIVLMAEILAHLKTYGDTKLQWQSGEPFSDASEQRVLLRASEFSFTWTPQRSLSRGEGMDLTHWSTDWKSTVGRAMLAYAQRRAVCPRLLEGGTVGYFRKGSLTGRLSFLCVERGVPVFAVGRAIRSEVKPKYLYPLPAECGGRGMADVVWNIDALREGAEAPLCEGVLSAMSAAPDGLASLGNVITPRQASKIAQRKPGAIIILREANVSRLLTEESAARLWNKGIPAFVADLINDDPNTDPSQMPEVLLSARESSESSLLLARLEVQKINLELSKPKRFI